jgi:hypothetical protein
MSENVTSLVGVGDVSSSVGQAGCAGVEGEALVMWLGDGGRRQGTCGFMRGWGRCSVSAQSLPEVLNSCLIMHYLMALMLLLHSSCQGMPGSFSVYPGGSANNECTHQSSLQGGEAQPAHQRAAKQSPRASIRPRMATARCHRWQAVSWKGSHAHMSCSTIAAA